jgi:hypothetical protein
MSKRVLVLPPKKLPPRVRLLCGDPPVLSSEKRTDYEILFSYIADYVKPTDPIEWLWLKDVVDHTWEIRRLRRFKYQLIEFGSPRQDAETALPHLPLTGQNDGIEIGLGFVSRLRLARDQLQKRRQEEALGKFRKPKRRPSEADAVQSLSQCINDYQTLDRLLISAEERRNAVLREIDRRRDGLAQRMRQASEDIIDAEFSEAAVAAE